MADPHSADRRDDQIRDRQAWLARRDRDRPEDLPEFQVARVFNAGQIPTQGDRYYAAHPVTVGGIEAEGRPGVLDVDLATTLLVRVLQGAAKVGDDLIAGRAPDRWVATLIATGTPGTLTLNVIATFCTGTGAPIAGVLVQISGPSGSFSGMTDSQGRISFTGLVAGSYTITGTIDGVVATRTFILNQFNGNVGANLPIVTHLTLSWHSCLNDGSARIEAWDDAGLLGTLDVSGSPPRGTLPLHRTISGGVRLVATYKGRTVTSAPVVAVQGNVAPCWIEPPFFADQQAIAILGCHNAALPGAHVTLDHAAGRLGAGDTDARGYVLCTGGIPAIPGEQITITASKDRYTTVVTTYQVGTFSTCGSIESDAVFLNGVTKLLPAPGFACLLTDLGYLPVKTQLFLTHPQGTIPIGYLSDVGTIEEGVWGACQSLAASGLVKHPDGVTVKTCGLPSDATAAPIGFRLQKDLDLYGWTCNQFGAPTLEDGHTCDEFAMGQIGFKLGTVPMTTLNEKPFVAQGTITIAAGTPLAQLFGAGLKTFTVSE